MSHMFNLLGLDTFDILGVGYGGGREFEAMPLAQREGPKIWSRFFGVRPSRVLYLSPEQLDLLYNRFAAANPKGVVSGAGDDFYRAFAPDHLTRQEVDRLEDEGKIFIHVFDEEMQHGFPHVRRYLPELFEPGVVEKMHRDPWLHVHLLGQAIREGVVPDGPGESSRWSPEWRAYCDRLIASGEYK
ncbi:hypothetical protein [Methylocystis bryophila]|uniref:Uncharacterized protein n=1 Tax=Methylocystis bryophila TaxID=655015 RepID=A0A1W6MX61_9HYPH|nr:hypothetical protein [Methylocystis bryophila]ARN82181.1 hypothetical protein B1812_15030 [Methylocystis bryophila]BDV38314.1 hypothetical protein DSM21852_15670 [Methylocystis bryophila]